MWGRRRRSSRRRSPQSRCATAGHESGSPRASDRTVGWTSRRPPERPSGAALAALVLDSPERARRALTFAIENRGLPSPTLPTRSVPGWGWTADARSLVEPTSRVLLAVNALTPSDRSTRDEAVGLLRDRQCEDGGWNYGNATVYDVDLRGYAQTTAIALIASRVRVVGSWRPGWASAPTVEPGARCAHRRADSCRLSSTRGRRRQPVGVRGSRGDRTPSVVPRKTAGGRMGCARDRPGRSARSAEVAPVTMTRRDLLVRSGALAAWAGAGGLVVAYASGRSKGRPLRGRAFPEPGRSAVAVLRADRYDDDLEGLLVDGLRLVEPTCGGAPYCSSRTWSSSSAGRHQHRSADGRRGRICAAAARSVLGRSRRGAGSSSRHRGGRRRVGAARRARRRAAPVRRPQRRAARPDAAQDTLHGLRELWVPRVLRETDVVVSMPKLKTHHWVGVTLSLKNCFGCMPGRVYGWPKDVFHVRGIPSRSSTSRRQCVRPSRSWTASSGCRATGRSMVSRCSHESSSSRGIRSPPTSPARGSWGWTRRRWIT